MKTYLQPLGLAATLSIGLFCTAILIQPGKEPPAEKVRTAIASTQKLEDPKTDPLLGQPEFINSSSNEVDAELEGAIKFAQTNNLDGIENTLALALFESNTQRKRRLLESLDYLSSADAATFLASAMATTSDADVLQATRRTIARLADADTIDALADLYREASTVGTQQMTVEQTLSGITNPAAIPGLAQLTMDHAHPELVMASAHSLGKIATSQALVALMDAWRNSTSVGNTALAGHILAVFSATNPNPGLRYFILHLPDNGELSEEWVAATVALADKIPFGTAELASEPFPTSHVREKY